jgi:hypothetical protein
MTASARVVTHTSRQSTTKIRALGCCALHPAVYLVPCCVRQLCVFGGCVCVRWLCVCSVVVCVFGGCVCVRWLCVCSVVVCVSLVCVLSITKRNGRFPSGGWVGGVWVKCFGYAEWDHTPSVLICEVLCTLLRVSGLTRPPSAWDTNFSALHVPPLLFTHMYRGMTTGALLLTPDWMHEWTLDCSCPDPITTCTHPPLWQDARSTRRSTPRSTSTRHQGERHHAPTPRSLPQSCSSSVCGVGACVRVCVRVCVCARARVPPLVTNKGVFVGWACVGLSFA